MNRFLRFAFACCLAGAATFATSRSAPASSFQTVYSFPNGPDGGAPNGPMVEVGGLLYGTTWGPPEYPSCGFWGNSYTCAYYGTVFQFDPHSNALTTLHSFDATTGSPLAGLVADRIGNIYGDTTDTLFHLNPATKAVTTLFSAPEPRLQRLPAIDKAGNLYGWRRANGYGEIDKFDPITRVVSLLYRFPDPIGSDDRDAAGGAAFLLLNPSETLLYGSYYGYAEKGRVYPGEIFQIDLATHVYTVLHSFGLGYESLGPAGPMAISGTGILFGVTNAGGPPNANCSAGCGRIFKFDPGTGLETTLYSFTGGSDGSSPSSGVALGPHGQLYGTTYGSNGAHPVGGTLFQFDLAHLTLTTLHAFTATGQVSWAEGPPTVASDGSIYCGGRLANASDVGALFRYIPDLLGTLPPRHGGPVLPTSVNSGADR